MFKFQPQRWNVFPKIIKSELLHRLCTNFYSAEMMEYVLSAKKAFKKLAVSYHCFLKSFLLLPKLFSNPLLCIDLNVSTFKLFLNLKLFKYLVWQKVRISQFFISRMLYFMKFSLYAEQIEMNPLETNQICDLLDNDTDAIMFGILCIQRYEPDGLLLGL